MSSDRRTFPVDILFLSALTLISWISTSVVTQWTKQISRSIEFYEMRFMLMSDRIKYLLHRRHRSPSMQIQRAFLFFPRPDFSDEIYPEKNNGLLRRKSIG